MAYNVYCSANFGPSYTGLTINGKLFDASGSQVGATITTGFVEVVAGIYFYTLSAPDGHAGLFVMYNSANADQRREFIVAPRETENADTKTSTRGTSTLTTSDIDTRLSAYDAPTKAELDATQAAITAAIAALNNVAVADILAGTIETGHSLLTVMRALYAANRGRSVADDPDDPTTITYYAPDNSTARIVHTLTDTERTVA